VVLIVALPLELEVVLVLEVEVAVGTRDIPWGVGNPYIQGKMPSYPHDGLYQSHSMPDYMNNRFHFHILHNHMKMVQS
jgi:hypothetical protein